MTITGEDNKKVFLKLIKLVIQKSNALKAPDELEIKKPFIKLNGKELQTLLARIAKGLNRENDPPLGWTTLRDYAFRCDPNKTKYPVFKASEKNLEFLCEFIGENSWRGFASKHNPRIRLEFEESFYTSEAIFSLIHAKRDQFPRIIPSCEKSLIEAPHSPEVNFNLGVCFLATCHYKKAQTFFDNCIQKESQNTDHYLFKALSLLGGMRPFRHKKISIDNILETIHFAMILNRENPFLLDIDYLIYKDFHTRIGYNIKEKKTSEISRNGDWLLFLSQCSGMTMQELKTILL